MGKVYTYSSIFIGIQHKGQLECSHGKKALERRQNQDCPNTLVVSNALV